MARTEIVQYQSEWAATFQRTAARLREQMADTAVRIDHIGNTSVVGLAAKDIIDIQVSVASLELGAQAARWFEAAELVLSDKVRKDHAVTGVVDGRDAWHRRMAVERAGERPIHVHIREAGSPNERYALLFRDYLRSNAAAVATYGLVMNELARLDSTGIDAYKAIKEPVCDLIVGAAERWAKDEDWQLPGSDA